MRQQLLGAAWPQQIFLKLMPVLYVTAAAAACVRCRQGDQGLGHRRGEHEEGGAGQPGLQVGSSAVQHMC